MAEPSAQATAARILRAFARTTNLLIAGRRIAVRGEASHAAALETLLLAIGARTATPGESVDYVFCVDEAAIAAAREEVAAMDTERARPTLLVDASGRDSGEPAPISPGLRAGISPTGVPGAVIVRPGERGVPLRDSPADSRIRWARAFMPVTAIAAEELERSHSLHGVRVGLSMVLEPKTAVLALALRDAGVGLSVFAHPDETDDDVVEALRDGGIPVFARSDATPAEHLALALDFLDSGVQLLIDDGSHLIRLAHSDRLATIASIRGAAEETTSGLRPLRTMGDAGALRFPVVAVNDARSKTLFDNRFGTGQSCVFAILDVVADAGLHDDLVGATVAIAGFGHVGEGVAHHVRALGGRVIVAETDPVRALQATFAGHAVQPLAEAVAAADLVISATGVRDTISMDILRACATDAVIAVAGGVPLEVAIGDAVAAGATRETIGERVERFRFPDGHTVRILDDGGCINVTAGEGNPIEIMDLSFAVQLAALEYLRDSELPPGVHPLPADRDDAVAASALRVAGIAFDPPLPTGDLDPASVQVDTWRTRRFDSEEAG